MTQAAAPTLYERLGGYDAICAATDELLGRLQADPRIRDYWKGLSAANKRKARQRVVDFMVEKAGGPAFYVGEDMKAAHTGMGIDEGDWAVFMEHAAATLDHLEVPEVERNDVLGFFTSLKSEIVEQL
jgi:hemoglobin